MGHSSINVSLTYLRGLEIAELKGRRYAYGLKDGAAFSSPLKSQDF